MKKKARKISIIAIIICVFVIKEAAWVSLIRPFTGPDELLHYRYIQTIFNEKQLPTLGQTLYRQRYELGGPASGTIEDTATITGTLDPNPGYLVNWIAQHPPLYYLVLLPVYGLLQSQNMLLVTIILRMISVLMAAVSLYFIFKTMQKLVPQNRILQAAVTCAIAFLPTFSFASATINSDNLETLLAAILIYFLAGRNEPQDSAVIARESEKDSRDAVIKWSLKTGIVMAFLALTKMTSLPLFLVVLIIQIFDFFRTKEPAKRKSVIYSTLIIFGIPLVAAGWWYLRNFMLYGTFFAVLKDAAAIHPEIITSFPVITKNFPEINPAAPIKLGFVDFIITRNFFVQYYKNIWGSALGNAELMKSWQFICVYIFTFIGFAGQIKKMYVNRISKGGLIKRAHDFLASGQGVLFLTFMVFLPVLTWKIFEMSEFRGRLSAMHGRYFLAATPALMYMLIRGWEHLAGKKWAGKATAFLIALFIFNDAVSLFYLALLRFH